ncbi:hypothetical protein F5X96DRAFT_222090 [Biscogniauxia mediterranea]|nr:hypothetical protein F5X96DRAFT_222090 [Biscogniauxia mediterranea]
MGTIAVVNNWKGRSHVTQPSWTPNIRLVLWFFLSLQCCLFHSNVFLPFPLPLLLPPLSWCLSIHTHTRTHTHTTLSSSSATLTWAYFNIQRKRDKDLERSFRFLPGGGFEGSVESNREHLTSYTHLVDCRSDIVLVSIDDDALIHLLRVIVAFCLRDLE